MVYVTKNNGKSFLINYAFIVSLNLNEPSNTWTNTMATVLNLMPVKLVVGSNKILFHMTSLISDIIDPFIGLW